MGLWATLTQCEAELATSPHDYEYVVVSNGEPVPNEVTLTLRNLIAQGRLVHIHSDEALTPPVARSRGVQASSGEYLCFLDNHCIVGSRYFDRTVAAMDRYNMAMLHSVTKFLPGDTEHYHYKLTLGMNFWGCTGGLPTHPVLPYQIAAGGHGGFAVRRSVWEAVGGYGPDDLLEGYGGEEFIFDLKLWRMGYDNWMDPKLIHQHWPGSRPYSRHYTDQYYVNLMVCALVIGSEKWLDKVYASFASGKHLRLAPKKHIFDLYETAYKRGISYAKELDSKCKYSLDEVLTKFRLEQIAHQ